MNENTHGERNEERPEPPSGPAPALIDLTGRAAPTPGPLTKPSPTIPPRRRRPRWLVPLVVVIVVAAIAGAAIAWWAA